MWIPYTDSVVAVKSNPTKKGLLDSERVKTVSLKPLQSLLRTHLTKNTYDTISDLTFPQLRDRLLDVDPLNQKHLINVNKAEAEYWQASSGCKSGPSDQIPGFDCGSQQWVLGVAFPTGTLENPTGSDLKFIYELKNQLKKANIWSSASSSYLSLIQQ